MRKELSKEEIYFLARVKKIEVQHLLKMRGMLDPKRVRSILIRYEYRERAKERRVSKRDIINMLMKRYDASRSYIESIIYEKSTSKKRRECSNCGEEITYYRWTRNNGLCNYCVNNNTVNNNEYGKVGDDSDNETT